MINKGYREIQSRDYTAAENYFKRAIVKMSRVRKPTPGYAKLYTTQNDMESAENVFLCDRVPADQCAALSGSD